MKRKILIILFLSWISFSCSEKKQKQKDIPNKIEAFDDFHEKFLTDTSFQLERIQFPVHGILIDNENAGLKENDSMIWIKDNWQHISNVSPEDLKTLKVNKTTTDSIVTYRIESPDGGFLFETKFKKTKGKWYLIGLTDIMI
jgi:hypothetical protein